MGNVNKIDPIDEKLLEPYVSQLLDILLRSPETISETFGDIALLVLLLRKKNLTRHLLSSIDLNRGRDFAFEVRDMAKDIFREHGQIMHSFAGNLLVRVEQFPTGQYQALLHTVESIPSNIVEEHFPQLFESLLSAIIRFQGKRSGAYIQPDELSDLMMRLGQDSVNGKVYNPFAGLASFAPFLRKESQYLGQEINGGIWVVGLFRMIAHGLESPQITYEQGDSIDNWCPYGFHPSLIISNPPFGLRIGHRDELYSHHEPAATAEQFFMLRALDSIAGNGRIIVATAKGFLFTSGTAQRIRQNLINGDILEKVISFPGGLLSYTGIPFSVLVVNKGKKRDKYVQFIDASDCLVTAGKRENRIDVDRVMALVEGEADTSKSRYVPHKEIKENRYLLNGNRYFGLEAETYERVELSNFCEVIGSSKGSTPERCSIVKVSDLTKNSDSSTFLLPKPISTEGQGRLFEINESALLVSMIGNGLRPTPFNYQGESIFFSKSTISALRIDSNKVDMAYLVYELQSDYVTRQLQQSSTGSVLQRIKRDDLLAIRINLPSLEEQRAKVKGIQEGLVQVQIEKARLQAKQFGLEKLSYSEVASLKHALGTPLLNVISGLSLLRKVIESRGDQNQVVKMDSLVFQDEETTIGDVFLSLKHRLESIERMLERNEAEFDVSRYVKTPINLIHFLKQFYKRVSLENHKLFLAEIEIRDEVKLQFKKGARVSANEDLLEMALGFIVDNAIRHGFLKGGLAYRMLFSLGINTTGNLPMLEISIANNGKPFPKGFDREKLIRKNAFASETGNTGLGGYDLNRIVESFQGSFDLVLNDEGSSEFTVEYIIQLPIIEGE
jgi:type I restriction enzyme M protein